MMSKPYFVSETSQGTSDCDQGAVKQSRLARWLRLMLASVARVDKAHAWRCALASLPQDFLSDTGLSPDDATGIASHQPDLPFFMQDGFGGR